MGILKWFFSILAVLCSVAEKIFDKKPPISSLGKRFEWWLPWISATCVLTALFVSEAQTDVIEKETKKKEDFRHSELIAINTSLSAKVDKLTLALAPFKEAARQSYPHDSEDIALSKLAQRTSKLETATADMKRQIEGRRLDSRQRSHLLKTLSSLAKQDIVIDMMTTSAEAFRFAQDLALLLIAAGWKPLKGPVGDGTPQVTGLSLCVPFSQKTEGMKFVQSFQAVGFTETSLCPEHLQSQATAWILTIGVKPN